MSDTMSKNSRSTVARHLHVTVSQRVGGLSEAVSYHSMHCSVHKLCQQQYKDSFADLMTQQVLPSAATAAEHVAVALYSSSAHHALFESFLLMHNTQSSSSVLWLSTSLQPSQYDRMWCFHTTLSQCLGAMVLGDDSEQFAAALCSTSCARPGSPGSDLVRPLPLPAAGQPPAADEQLILTLRPRKCVEST
jgi:hypothetical protein